MINTVVTTKKLWSKRKTHILRAQNKIKKIFKHLNMHEKLQFKR